MKVPNYIDDVENFEQFDEEAPVEYSGDVGAQYEEEHEIEGVFYHYRDEGRENDPEDLWHDNVVRTQFHECILL